jgi:hypothetical protein
VGLVGVGGDVRLQEGADLVEPLLLRLPQSGRRHRVTGGGGRASSREGGGKRRRREEGGIGKAEGSGFESK